MTSQFGQQIYQRRHELTVQLIEKLLGIKQNDENHALALDFCLQKEYHHSYSDVDPRTVESFYISVIQRLHEDSQLSKALALSALATKFISYNLSSTTADLNHNLLQLLASLANKPLESVLEETTHLLSAVYQPAQDKTDEQHQQQRAAVQRCRHLASGSSSVTTSDLDYTQDSGAEAEYDPYGEESESDSWDTDEDTKSNKRQLHGRQGTTPDVPATSADPASQDSQQSMQQLSVNAVNSTIAVAPRQAAGWCLPAALLQAPPQLQPGLTMPQPEELLAQLAMRRVDKLPLMRPDPQFCFTESYLSKQLLCLLQGHPAHGFKLSITSQLDSDKVSEGGATDLKARGGVLQQLFTPDARVTSPALSPGALGAVMQEFAAAGTAARQLAKLAQQLTQSRGKAWLPQASSCIVRTGSVTAGDDLGTGGTAVTPCLRALGVALQQQLDHMGQQLAQLQSAIITTHYQSHAVQKHMSSLLYVKQQTRPIIQRLHVLHDAVLGVLKQSAGSAATVSASLLDGLYERAQAAALSTSGHQGAADAAALLHLLLCTCVPIVAALAQWLWSAADGSDTESLLAGLAEEQDTDQQFGAYQGVNVCCEDFFIVRKSGVAATDARFWHAAYDFSRAPPLPAGGESGTEAAVGGDQPAGASDEGSVACPSFLLPLVSSIMTAGKSVRLLDYMEQEQLRHSMATPARTSVVQPSAASRRQSISSTMQRAPRPQSSTIRAARVSSIGGAARKRWDETASCSAQVTDLTKQVRLQLAMAAGAAEQDEEQQLGSRFIDAASSLLQHSQQMLQQRCLGSLPRQIGDKGAVAQQPDGQSSSSTVMLGALQAAGQQLAQVCSQPAVSGQLSSVQQLQLSQPLGLRQALLLARKRRIAKQNAVADTSHLPAADAFKPQKTQKKPLQQQQHDDQAEEEVHIIGRRDDENILQPESGPQEGAQVIGPCVHEEGAETNNLQQPIMIESHLLQWKQQVDAKLLAAGQCVQQLAPWQHAQQKGGSGSSTSHWPVTAPQSAPASLTLLGSKYSTAPGSFSSSLAELWPLRSDVCAVQPQQQCSSKPVGQGQQKWPSGGQWPCEQLKWLLVDPPQQIMPLAQLLDQALLHPIQARVDLVSRQLLSSLMGEWGLLQQLQGLVGFFLLASPAMVEWTDSCFATAEAVASGKRNRMLTGSSGNIVEPDSSPARAAKDDAVAASAVGSGGSSEGYPAVTVDDLDVMELSLLLQDLSSSSTSEDPLPDPSCLHLTVDKKAHLRHLQQPLAQQQGQGAADKAAMDAAGATGGLFVSAAEWASLSCRHSGTWQLSLVYNTEELNKFSKAWQFLLQLRWVRRRIDAARHAACKGSASFLSAAQQDAAEQAAVEAAYQEIIRADGSRYKYGAGSASDQTNWLSTRQELLLLQEISHFMARYQQYIMDKMIRGAWIELQEALGQADTLDQVRVAAAAFLHRVCTLCNCQWRTMGQKGIATRFASLMNIALQAAAAAAQITKHRRHFREPGRHPSSAMSQKLWLDLAAARSRLKTVQVDWHNQCSFWLSLVNMQLQARTAGDRENAQTMLSALDLDEYYRRVAGIKQPLRPAVS